MPIACRPNSGLRKYTLNGGLFTLPLRGLFFSKSANSFCCGVNCSGAIGGKRTLSAAITGNASATASPAATASFFIDLSRLDVGQHRILRRRIHSSSGASPLPRGDESNYNVCAKSGGGDDHSE